LNFNFRSKITSLQHVHRKDIKLIKKQLENIQCQKCQSQETSEISTKIKEIKKKEEVLNFKPIGYVKTVFTEKRAVPRQAIVGDSILSRIEITRNVFSSNPEQSLEGLEDFSHIWVFFVFHKNPPFYKPKVFPPRLNGKNVGVLSTRSPHRPNPIGISLVKIHRIEDTTIYFYGTDMVAQTPVIDIKPYISAYDAPQNLNEVKIPDWIRSSRNLKVNFSENSLRQIENFKINVKSLEEVLENDPRSVYVREKYQSQEFHFKFNDKNIVCEFDDEENCVNVVELKESL
jgi:tRNA-Thr(GGU) m(6)t(6)A37 methyltransferase TsaA